MSKYTINIAPFISEEQRQIKSEFWQKLERESKEGLSIAVRKLPPIPRLTSQEAAELLLEHPENLSPAQRSRLTRIASMGDRNDNT